MGKRIDTHEIEIAQKKLPTTPRESAIDHP